jgi:hypothetical protein
MHRRVFLQAVAGGIALECRAQAEPAQPRQKVSAGTLFGALSARFPVRLSLGGLLDMQVDAQRLLLLAARQKLGATLSARMTGLALRAAETGELDVLFSLRYERTDRTLRAFDPEMLDLRWPGLPPDASAALKGVLPGAVREAIGEFVLHRFSDRDLALPDAMGFEPGRIEIVDDGLVIGFVAKKR